jgi:Cu(I)/Ag(I) efflux system membrane fusion protein
MNEQQSSPGVMLSGAPRTATPEGKAKQQPAPRGVLFLLAVLTIGIAIGAGLAWAHFTGRLAPLYHKVGLHTGHQHAEQPSEGSSPALGEHAGHGGMSMPKSEGAEPSKLPGYAVVKITPERQQRIGVRTGKVVHRHPLTMSVRAVGIIEVDQTRLKRVHVHTSGWVEKVHVNFVGQNVKEGDPLLEIYSPELANAQSDFVRALNDQDKEGKTERASRDVKSARRRLQLWGVPADEIEAMEKTRKTRDTLLLKSEIDGRVLERNVQEGSYVEPTMDLYRIAGLSEVWLQAKLYEYELPHVALGQPVHVLLPSRPDLKEIEGKVSFIEPVVQEATRTVKVRVAIKNVFIEKNKDYLLKPGTYADLVIDHDMGHGLLVPESGLLRTGERVLAFRVLPGNRFEPVEVTVGTRFKMTPDARSEDGVQVLAGLDEGDEVVTSAAFLIDAESRLKSALAGMSGHQHDSAAPPKKPDAPDPHQGHKGHEHPGHDH